MAPGLSHVIGTISPRYESGQISGSHSRRKKLLFPVENLTCHPAFRIGVGFRLAYYYLKLKLTLSSVY
jgi:hypothetical protein